MPLTQCYFHQLENNDFMLLQGTEVYIDPEVLTPMKVIEWAFEQSKISNTEQLALMQMLSTSYQSSPTPDEWQNRLRELKIEKENWAYKTCDDLSDPATRMHDHLLYFRNKATIDAQIAFDQIGLVFSRAKSSYSPQRTVIAQDTKALNDLLLWFEERMNILIKFSEFPEEEIVQNDDLEKAVDDENEASEPHKEVFKPTSEEE